jgi:UDP-N-acetylmuramoyl-tripeptide--D-alanyl-D-alanine ligase
MSTQPLWTVAAMADAMHAVRVGTLPDAITGISIDSRTLTNGEAYFAIKGDVHDGHDFVDAALKNGAGLAVVAESHRIKFDERLPLLVVPDVLAGLIDLAHASRTRSQA